jgi:hypothetical protein
MDTGFRIGSRTAIMKGSCQSQLVSVLINFWPASMNDFSNGPPKISIAKTRGALSKIIRHSLMPQAAPIHAVNQTQAAVVSPCTRSASFANNDTSAQRSNPGHYTLNDATRFGVTALGDGEYDQRGAKRHQPKCAHARRLAMKITVEAQRDARQCRSTES